MKTKIYILLGLCFLACQGVHSQVVSMEMAQQVAETFFISKTPSEYPNIIQTHSFGNREIPTMYAFSLPQGWVLVAGDKRVRPILAYSDINGSIFPAEEDMPDGMLYLVEWYSEQIEAFRNDNAIRGTHPQWEAYSDVNNGRAPNRSVIVAPLLTRNGNENEWKQKGNANGYDDGNNDIDKSYNKFCPTISNMFGSCDHAIVGCVALATAQVMWYWQWPYAAVVQNNQQYRYYNWTLMPYRLTNSSSLSQADMIANLLHDVGVDSKMIYLCQDSYARPTAADSALNDIYHYTTSHVKWRSDFSNNTWINMIEEELDESRPVIYGGESSVNRNHVFVIDGYDSNDMFHVNFGNAASLNGYYSLDDIYFNDDQLMIMGIQPDYPSCTPITIPSTDVWGTNFAIQNGGGINVGNRTITNGMRGSILSGEYVKLTSGFKVNMGAEVYIDVKDMHCDDRAGTFTHNNEKVHQAPQKLPIPNTPSSAYKILRNGQVLIERNGHTYTLTGTEIK